MVIAVLAELTVLTSIHLECASITTRNICLGRGQHNQCVIWTRLFPALHWNSWWILRHFLAWSAILHFALKLCIHARPPHIAASKVLHSGNAWVSGM